MSSSSSAEYERTAAPRLASWTTRPSTSSRRSASRTGVRLTSRRAASSSSFSRVPAGRSPSRIASRVRSAATALELGTRAVFRVVATAIAHIVYGVRRPGSLREGVDRTVPTGPRGPTRIFAVALLVAAFAAVAVVLLGGRDSTYVVHAHFENASQLVKG